MDEDIRSIVIIGGGLAGAHAAQALRERSYDGALTLLAAEQHPPYERPPLSKGILLGEATADSAVVHPLSWYDEQGIDLRCGVRAESIDREAREVLLAGGERLGYDRLLLAPGANPRRLRSLEVEGADVRYLRTLDDSVALKERLSGRLLIIGGGWIGLEVAAAARAAGGTVTVAVRGELPLVQVLGREVAEVFAGLHREHGVDLRTQVEVKAVRREGEVTIAELSDGSVLEVDTILVGIGAAPAIELAAAAGLPGTEGIEVDAALRTVDPRVCAAGDVALHDHPRLGRMRVDHWDAAIEQGKHVAGTLLGSEEPYERLPYFFTDQYDLGMEYVGHPGERACEEVRLLGDVPGRVFRAYWLRDGTVVAGMHVNDWDAIEEVRRLVGGDAADLPG
ncbi:NAD(P)/FAD-dependent oxidoreductase [Brachybacterium hainanense]|uniref:NAD(P)/FAD-dependent oxidoreductase n=1 Tax=Brachybacterium hainanense TaxID=1541174 RepID=A0ABV6RDA8_9MICO